MKTRRTLIKFYFNKIAMPHTFVLLSILIGIAGLLTYLIPAGEFERVKDMAGRLVVGPGTFHFVSACALPFYEIPLKMFKGLMQSSDIVFFILIIGGVFEIITYTNTITVFVGKLSCCLCGREKWIISIFLSAFSVGGFTMGMSNEVLVFVPIGIIMAHSLGFDALIGTSMVLLGAQIGFTAGLMNPFNVGIAQAVAQLPLFSGMWLRVILLISLLTVTSLYIFRYASKIKNDPGESLVADLNYFESDYKAEPNLKIEIKHYGVLFTIAVSLLFLLYGVIVKKWWIDEMAALFLAMGIGCGVISGQNPNQIARHFLDGVKGIAFGALVVGFARAIIVVIQDGKIIDSLVFYLANSIAFLPAFLQPLGMYVINVIISLLLVSASGMAVATMPIMIPLADLLGITRQTAVLMFQCADGMTHLILPTSAATMGALGAARIPFDRWIKFIWPLEVAWLMVGGLFVIYAHFIQY